MTYPRTLVDCIEDAALGVALTPQALLLLGVIVLSVA